MMYVVIFPLLTLLIFFFKNFFSLYVLALLIKASMTVFNVFASFICLAFGSGFAIFL